MRPRLWPGFVYLLSCSLAWQGRPNNRHEGRGGEQFSSLNSNALIRSQAITSPFPLPDIQPGNNCFPNYQAWPGCWLVPQVHTWAVSLCWPLIGWSLDTSGEISRAGHSIGPHHQSYYYSLSSSSLGWWWWTTLRGTDFRAECGDGGGCQVGRPDIVCHTHHLLWTSYTRPPLASSEEWRQNTYIELVFVGLCLEVVDGCPLVTWSLDTV